MLAHPNIKIMLNTDYHEIEGCDPATARSFSRGRSTSYFDYRFGKLPYRSLEFRFETLNVPRRQPAPVINYPNDNAYTRVTEFKYLTGQEHPKTTLVYEYSASRRRPVLSRAAAGERGALSQVPRTRGRDSRRAFHRAARHLQVLQHGSGGCAGARHLLQNRRCAAP